MRRSSSTVPSAPLAERTRASLAARTCRCFSTSSTITRRWKPGAGRIEAAVPDQRPALRPLWTFFKLYVFKQGFRDGVEGFMFCALSGRFGGGAGLEASRADPGGEGLMIAEHEARRRGRFDALRGRFKREVAPDDPRLGRRRACSRRLPGRRVLDLGCGKGRFAGSLTALGAAVVGLDLSAGMLARGDGLRSGARLGPAAAVWRGEL